MKDWTKNYVIVPIPTTKAIQEILKNMRIVLYKVEAPLDIRVERAGGMDKIQDFVEKTAIYEKRMTNSCKIEFERLILNNHKLVADLIVKELAPFNFSNFAIVRPDWERYFMLLAKLVASRTNCMKRAVGCVITRDDRVVSTGYNGTPYGMPNCLDGGCARCNSYGPSGQGLEECYCIHAEANAVIEAGRKKTIGATAYVTTIPCLSCAKLLVQSGIIKIVFDQDYDMPIVKKFFIENPHIKVCQKEF